MLNEDRQIRSFILFELIWNKMFILRQTVHTQTKSGIASCADEIKPFHHIQIVWAFSLLTVNFGDS